MIKNSKLQLDQQGILEYLINYYRKIAVFDTNKKANKISRNRQKQAWLIIINALKQHDILSTKELKEISELGIF